MKKTFSVITVSYNTAEGLKNTLKSVFEQSLDDYEVIVKDGGSSDGSVEKGQSVVTEFGKEDCVRFIEGPDSGIYDAMNIAIPAAEGDYLIFLNCGDYFAGKDTLSDIKAFIEANPGADIYYGDRFNRLTHSYEYAANEITEAVCFRNVPCHQSIVYKRDCFEGEKYRTEYKVRADYEHFLRCVLKEGRKALHTGIAITSYEAGGFSESERGREISKREHREITGLYMSKWHLFLYRARLVVTLQPLREKLAGNEHFSGIYNALVKLIYKR